MEMLPREKMITSGPNELLDEELLAIMLGVGTKEENVFELSKRLVESYGLKRLCDMSYEELSKIPGIKKAKATKLMAVFEITKRILYSKKDLLTDSKSVFEYVYSEYIGLKKEKLMVIYVDSSISVIKKEVYFDDSYSEVRIPIKKILKSVLEYDPFGIFLIHNHPGGNKYPSEADIKHTKNLEMMLNQMNIHLLDHIIIARDEFFSFLDDKAFLYHKY